MAQPVNPEVCDGEIGGYMQRALEACRHSEGPSVGAMPFSVRALEHSAYWLSLTHGEATREYLLALAAFAVEQNDPGYSIAKRQVVIAREKLLMALGDDRIEGSVQ